MPRKDTYLSDQREHMDAKRRDARDISTQFAHGFDDSVAPSLPTLSTANSLRTISPDSYSTPSRPHFSSRTARGSLTIWR